MPMTNNGENVADIIIWSSLSTSGTNGIIRKMVNRTPATISYEEEADKFEWENDSSYSLLRINLQQHYAFLNKSD